MKSRKFLVMLAISAGIFLTTMLFNSATAEEVSPDRGRAVLPDLPVVADFEGGLPADWFQYGDPGVAVLNLEVVTVGDADPLALPGQVGNNDVLSGTVNVPTWGGFGAALMPVQDWSSYDAASFWFYGENSGTTHEFEIQTASSDDRRANFVDNFTGWQQIVMPFTSFGAGGAYDVSAVDNWVFVLDGTVGSFKMDNLQLLNLDAFADFEGGVPADWFQYGDPGVANLNLQVLTIGDTNPLAVPGQVGDNDVFSATVAVPTWGGFGAALMPVADWSSMQGVGFWFYGENSNITYQFEIQTTTGDDRRATFADNYMGWHYITLPFTTFGAGGVYDVSAVDNWVFVLDGITSSFNLDHLAVYGNAAPPPPPPPPNTGAIVADFEGGFPADWFQYGDPGVAVLNLEVVTVSDADPMALPGQIGDNDVLSGTVNVPTWGGFGAALMPVGDWSDYDSISFWFFGENSGTTHEFEIQTASGDDRRATFVDDFTGWQQIIMPFATFGAGGAYDVTQVDNWVFVLDGTVGSFKMDDLQLFNLQSFADFEDGFPTDWFQYGDPGVAVLNLEIVPENVPNPLAGSNQVLSGTVNVPTWGGFGAAFMPPADWSDMVGVSFWFYGENSGTTHEFEIQTVAGDDRRATFDDNFVGWQYIVMPFNTFGGGGAYDVSQVDNWVFVLDGTIGSFKMDEVAVYGDAGNAALKVQFDTDNFDVMEGDTATISVTLNMTSTNTVMVDYATADGSADSADYTSASGTLTFAPGETVQTFTVDTTDDMEYEGDETVVLNLSGVVSATIAGSGSATLTIIDNEMPPPPPAPGHADIVDDFEMGDLPSGLDGDGIGIGFVTWSDGSPVAITTTTVADAGISPRPGADDTNTVLDLTLNINSWGGFSHAFENETVDTWVPQDWSSYEGFGIWIHGANNGSILFIDLIENRNPGSTTDDGERWTYAIDDDFTGWEYFAIPFDDFTRKEIGNGAPQDGWSGEEVHGWALGSLTTGGEVTYYVDDAGILLRTTTVDDFEDGQLPSGTDGDGVGIGFVTFQDGNSSVAIAATNPISDGIAQVPGRPDDNIALNLEMDVNTFAGFSHAFENAAVDTWVPQDWSTYEGVCFWIYGNNSGSTLFMDLIENRNPGSTTDDAERWSVEIADDFDGWQFMIIPFTDFNRKEIGNGAPNDGWTGEEAHGWALGGLNTGGLRSYYIDEFTIYGNTGDVPSVLEAEFAAIEYNVTEGASVDLTVALNTPPTQTVTISYVTAESIATPDRDFIPVMGELVFAPGETEKTITLQTLEDIKDEINERLIVQLTDIDGAEFGFLRRTTVLIEDNDATDPALVDDFEGFVPYEAYGNVSLGIMEIADDSPDALPMQGPWEQVLTVEYGAAGRAGDMNGFGRSFPAAEDWSAYQGMSVWVYGNNSGDTVTINLYDNQTMTTADTTPDTWELVWSDEFNGAAGTGPDPNTWTHELGDGALNDITGWGNGELQYYTDSTDNAAMDGNGNLVLTAKETDPNSDYLCWYGQCEYTSARLISAGKQAQQFGRIEIRAQVPFGQGIWPALWMLGTDIEEVGWPQTGEIDIMEYVGWAPNAVFGTLHGPGYSGGNALGSGLYDIGEPVADAYHEFSVEWQPGEVRWYIDGVNFFTADTTDTPLGDGSDWVYDHPFFFILNIAVGGNFPGNPDDTSTYPQTLAVDYVRLYQAADNAERFEATIVDDFNGWQKVVIPFSDFTRSEDQPVGAPDDGLTLTDVWGYGFEMPASSAPTLAGGNMMYFDQVHLELNTTPTDVSITGFGDSQSNGWLVVVTLLALIFVGFGYWQVRRFSMR